MNTSPPFSQNFITNGFGQVLNLSFEGDDVADCEIEFEVYTSNYNGYGVSSFGATNGFIEINVTPDPGFSQSSYSYQWTGLDYFGWWPENIVGSLCCGNYSSN